MDYLVSVILVRFQPLFVYKNDYFCFLLLYAI
jgi:hypothetical protein